MAVETGAFTAEDLLRVPSDGFVHELVDGELRKMSPAGFEHGRIAAIVCASLVGHVRRLRLGEVAGAETGFLLRRNPDTVRAPDVSFVRGERIVETPGYFPGAPDLAVEVLSPGDTYSEVEAKVLDWLRSGARMVVIVDPAKRSATVHHSLNDVKRLAIDDTVDGADVVPGWRLSLREMFGE